MGYDAFLENNSSINLEIWAEDLSDVNTIEDNDNFKDGRCTCKYSKNQVNLWLRGVRF
jgi:hypothetical protein